LIDDEDGDEAEREEADVCKMFAKEEDLASEPRRTRTSNRLIKSQLLCQLS
jgi:hypothetical protein